MTTTMTKPATPRARGAAPPPAEARLPLATDHDEYKVLLDRRDRLRGEAQTLRERLAEAEADASDRARALAEGRAVAGGSAEAIRAEVDVITAALGELTGTPGGAVGLIETALTAASRAEAARVAPDRALVATRGLDGLEAFCGSITELAEGADDHVRRGFRRPELPGWAAVSRDAILAFRQRSEPLVRAFQQIQEAGQ